MKRIMLICSAGMSTSLLVTKMLSAAKEKGLIADIFAVSTSDAALKIEDKNNPIDAILLGPQVRFIKKQIEDKVEGANIPVDIIDMKDYGTMNGKSVLEFALKLLE